MAGVNALDIRVGTKILFLETYINEAIRHEGVVTKVLAYNKELGLAHFMVEGYPHPVSLTMISCILEQPTEASKSTCKVTMTKEAYRQRLKEIYNEIGSLGAERDKMVVERTWLIRDDLAAMGLKQGMEVDIIDGGIKRHCTFNGVRSNYQWHIYLEFTYPMDVREIRMGMSNEYVVNHPHIVDINNDITIILPDTTIDYHTFINQYQ